MKRAAQILTFITIVILMVIVSFAETQPNHAVKCPAPPANPPHKKVLVLFPYQSNLPGDMRATQAINQEFDQAVDLKAELYFEYLDLNRFPDNAYQKQLLSLLAVKYGRKAFDLVIIVKEVMLDFWLAHRGELLPDTPVVFFGIRSERIASKQISQDVICISATVDYMSGIEWFLKIRPAVKEVFIVNGVGTADREVIQPVETLKGNLRSLVQVTDLSDLPLTEIKRRVAVLSENSVVFFHTMFEDAAGIKYRPIDVLRELVSISPVPIISGHDQNIGIGTIGGFMYSSDLQARFAVQSGLRILRGEPPNLIPQTSNQFNRFIFDHPALQHYGIDLSELPEGSIVKNRKYSAWELYRSGIIITCLSISILMVSVFLLTVLNKRLKTARQTLREVNANLETQVQERTVALVQTNSSLEKEIADRRYAEEALMKSEARLLEVLENSLDASYKRNFQTQTYDYLSPAFTRIAGYTADEMKSFSMETISGYIHPDDLAGIEHTLAESVSPLTGRVYKLEYRFKHKNGQYRWLHDQFTLMHDALGKPLACIGSLSDITDRKQAEVEREKLEALNRQLLKAESLSRMAGAIAHHFNNQLQVVSGNLELALGELPGDTGEYEKCLTSAMNAAHRASEVSSLMLTYLGQTRGKSEKQDLSETCRRYLPLLRVTLPKNVDLEADLPSPGPIVCIDTNQLHQILTNLLTNASEAMNNTQGSVFLSVTLASQKEISELHRFPADSQTLNNAYACLQVIDTGCGIANEDIDKIFDPFFSRKFIGRGLGLAVVLGMVKTQAGIITIDSKPGFGSTFRVYLPLSEEHMPRPPGGDASLIGPIREVQSIGTVLVIEDEEEIRSMSEIMVRSLGYKVLVAKDGVEAVELLQQQRNEIRLVISDLSMPRLDGWETLMALRHLVPGIPVILVSGHSMAHVLNGEHSERPQAVLSKPYRRDQLREIIHQVLTDEDRKITV